MLPSWIGVSPSPLSKVSKWRVLTHLRKGVDESDSHSTLGRRSDERRRDPRVEH